MQLCSFTYSCPILYFQTYLFDLYVVDLGVMAMKEYSTLFRVSGLKPHHQIQFIVIPKTFLFEWIMFLSREYSWPILNSANNTSMRKESDFCFIFFIMIILIIFMSHAHIRTHTHSLKNLRVHYTFISCLVVFIIAFISNTLYVILFFLFL